MWTAPLPKPTARYNPVQRQKGGSLQNEMTNCTFMQQLGNTGYMQQQRFVASLSVSVLAHLEGQKWHTESASLSRRPCCTWSLCWYSPTLLKYPLDCPWPQLAVWGGRPLHAEALDPHAAGFEGRLSVCSHVLLWNWLWTQQSSYRKREISLAQMHTAVSTEDIIDCFSSTWWLMVLPPECSPPGIPLYTLWKRKWKQWRPGWIHCTRWEACILHHKNGYGLECHRLRCSCDIKQHKQREIRDQ